MDSQAPPPALSPEQRSLQKRRKRLISSTAFGVLIALAGGGVWAYFSYRPAQAQVLEREGTSLLGPGHYQEAVDRFNQALELQPNRSGIYAKRGLAYQNLGRMDLALQDYETALLADPNLTAVFTARGIIYRERGDLPKAIEEFSRALKIHEDPDTYYERAQTYDLQGEHGKAIADFDNVIARLRDAPHVLRARAQSKLKLGDREGYEADLAEARAFETRAYGAVIGAKQ